MKLTVTLPIPPKCLNPNARPHYMAKANATKAARWDATLAGINARNEAALPAPFKTATTQVTFYVKFKRKRDSDNFLSWCKAYFDGLADAGVIENDSGFTHRPVNLVIDKADPRVVIEIEGD